MPELDAHEVFFNLWQGSVPHTGSMLHNLGFDVLVLCAQEYQPPSNQFDGLQVIHAPNDDNFERRPSRAELMVAIDAAKEVAHSIASGLKVLVTCMAGRNRSGLVSAIAIHRLTQKPGVECIELIQSKRPHALRNPQFNWVLRNIL